MIGGKSGETAGVGIDLCQLKAFEENELDPVVRSIDYSLLFQNLCLVLN